MLGQHFRFEQVGHNGIDYLHPPTNVPGMVMGLERACKVGTSDTNDGQD